MMDKLLKLLESGQDSALLRFGLGGAYLKQKEPSKAVDHLKKAVAMDPAYSAAWKLYGKALQQTGSTNLAIEAYSKGIEIAEKKGDVQAAKEMKIFLKRLRR